MLHYKPIRMEGDLAVFSSGQLDLYGDPDLDLYPQYIVIEGSPIYMQSYAEVSQAVLKKVHHYDRQARFKSALKHVLGQSNIKSKDIEPIIAIVSAYVRKDDPDRYENTLKILKHYKAPHLYKHVPAILHMAGKDKLYDQPQNMSAIFEAVLTDFINFQHKFYESAEMRSGRVYFPHMKYLAIRFLEKRGVHLNIPKLKTKRKIKAYDELFNKLVTNYTEIEQYKNSFYL